MAGGKRGSGLSVLWARNLLALLGVASFLLVGSTAVFEVYHADRIYPGVRVGRMDVGGRRLSEAAALLEEEFDLGAPQVTLRGPQHSWVVRPIDLGFRLDAEATLAPAYQAGRGSSWIENLWAHLRLLAFGETFAPVVVYDARVARLYLEALSEQVNTPPVDAALSLDGLLPVVHPARAGYRLDVDATLEVLRPALARLAPVDVALVIREVPPDVIDAEPARAEAEALLAGPLTLVLPNPKEGDPGPWVIQPEQLAAMVATQADGGILHATLDKDALCAYLDQIAPELAIEPVDARFRFIDSQDRLEPISPSVAGRALDVEASAASIVQAVTGRARYAPLVLRDIPPRYPETATAQELGIRDLVAVGESSFAGSPSGRDHNVRLAASKFNGLVIAPGETFSFNHYLGPVTAEEGYDEAYVTAGEQLAVEVGGGICQVSTTLFRAAFWGGYPIVERWYHYQRVDYYEPSGVSGVGMDATVYSPLVDFRFLNDRPYPLLIEAEIDDAAHALIFRFYSTSDGRRVEMEGPVITDETAPGPPIYQLDADMAPGTVVKWQSAKNGMTVTIERRVYDAAGNLLYHNTFVSRYAPRREAYHYGPGYTPPEE